MLYTKARSAARHSTAVLLRHRGWLTKATEPETSSDLLRLQSPASGARDREDIFAEECCVIPNAVMRRLT